MKIIYVLNHFLPAQVAGTEVYVFGLCKEMQKQNIEAKVIIPNYNHPMTEVYFYDEIEIIKYAETSVQDRALIMDKRIPEGVSFFIEILKREKPDVIHFHEIVAGNGITLHHLKAAKEAGFKIVFTFHLSGYTCKTGNLMYKNKVYCDGVIHIDKCTYCSFSIQNNNSLITNLLFPPAMLSFFLGIDTTRISSRVGTALGFPFLIKKLKTDLMDLIESCDSVVALTNWYQEILVKNGAEENKISIITQGLAQKPNIKNWKNIETKLPIKLVFVGRISPLKGIHLLITALKNISVNDITLDIFGEAGLDEYSTYCQRESEGLLNIRWRGMLKPEGVIDELTKYDVLCLPSTFSEMSPLVIQEAFAAGIPVIASNVYGNSAPITDGENGWLFNFNDSKDLQEKLQMLLKNPDLVDVAKKNIPLVKPFDEVANEYIKLYKEIINYN